MTEHDIAEQLEASLSAVRGAFARVNQAVGEDDALSALRGMADTIVLVAKFADAAAKAVDVVAKERDAARAEIAKLQAEVAKLRGQATTWKRGTDGRSARCAMADKPTWRKDGDAPWLAWRLMHGDAQIGAIARCNGLWFGNVRGVAINGKWRGRDKAMGRIEQAAGFSECEVCDEP